MIDNKSVFIPTRGRVNRQITLRYLKPEIAGWKTKIIVPEFEYKHWLNSDYPVATVPDDYNFSQIRQYIINNFKEEYHIIADDDLRFYKRIKNPSATSGLALQKTEDVAPILNIIIGLLEQGFTHGGLSERFGNVFHENDIKYDTRCTRFHFYNRDILCRQNFKLDDVVTKQDLHSILSMLELGFSNAVIYNFCQEQDGDNSSGGCGWYRTKEVTNQQAEHFVTLHPKFSKVIEKNVVWNGVKGKIKDVRIQWKKAFGSRSMERVENEII